MARRLAALCLLLGVAAAPAGVPEPSGYWLGPEHGALPATIRGGRVVHTSALRALLRGPRRVVLLDVASAPRRPANMATGAPWLPPPHRDIPGSTWVPDAGQGAISPAFDTFLRQRLAALTGGDEGAPIVVYCHPACWMSWNAAKRVISYGYRAVYWYPDGVEAWARAGNPVAPATPEGPGQPMETARP